MEPCLVLLADALDQFEIVGGVVRRRKRRRLDAGIRCCRLPFSFCLGGSVSSKAFGRSLSSDALGFRLRGNFGRKTLGLGFGRSFSPLAFGLGFGSSFRRKTLGFSFGRSLSRSAFGLGGRFPAGLRL